MAKAPPGHGKPQLRIRIEPEQLEYLQVEAERRGKTVSELARQVLSTGLSSYKIARAQMR